MESPPPYYSSAPKKSNTGLIVGLILGGIGICCILPVILLAGGGWWAVTKAKGFVGCSFTFVNLQRSIQDYTTEHDGHFPSAATWETDIKPYYTKEVAKHAKEQSIFSTDSKSTLGCTNDDTMITGISFNKALSGKKLTDVKDPFSTVVLFEVPTAGSNLNSDYKPQPFASSPKMFNTQRGWYVAHVSGQPALMGRDGQAKDVNINVDTRDSGGAGN